MCDLREFAGGVAWWLISADAELRTSVEANRLECFSKVRSCRVGG
jgi:hypothetical protein